MFEEMRIEMVSQVEAGLNDLRQAYAELHQELDQGAHGQNRPPVEEERIRKHVSGTFIPAPSKSLYPVRAGNLDFATHVQDAVFLHKK